MPTTIHLTQPNNTQSVVLQSHNRFNIHHIYSFTPFVCRYHFHSSRFHTYSIQYFLQHQHLQLSLVLAFLGSASVTYSHHISAIPCYPFMSSDYPTLCSIFSHHIIVGSILIVGAGAHASIYILRSLQSSFIMQAIFSHRDIITGHLIWVCIFLGFHSFGLYIHNDILSATSSPQDIFSDSSIQLRPVFSTFIQSLGLTSPAISLLEQKVTRITLELGTADFIVHHIPCIHHSYNSSHIS